MDVRTRVVSNVLRARAEQMPDAKFVKCNGDWVTFGEAEDRARRLAGAFHELGLRKGDRVAVLTETRDEAFVTMLANAVAGTVNVGLNTFLKGEFLRYQINDSGATTIVLDAAGWRAVRPIVATTPIKNIILLDNDEEPVSGIEFHRYTDLLTADLSAPDPGLVPADLLGLLYTSGTTGDPKGCMLSHGYYTNVPRSYLAGERVLTTDRIFTAFPFFHTAGQVIIFMAALCNPTEVVFEPVFHATTFIKRATEEEATVLWGVGAVGLAILAQPESPEDAKSRFRLAQFQPLPPAKQEEFETRFKTPVITEGYGQTECTPITASKLSDPRRRDSVGRPTDHLEVRLVDEYDEPVERGSVGEVVVRPRSPEVMFSGYWNKPEATVRTTRNYWHHTGDFARQDEDGYVYFVDRKSDAIRRRGENISSFAVEAVIRTHPAVANVAVIGVPSDMTEDDVMAMVVVKEGHSLTPHDFFEFCKDRMPYFALPRFLQLRNDIPVNALGKVVKHQLRAEGSSSSAFDLHEMGLVLERHERR